MKRIILLLTTIVFAITPIFADDIIQIDHPTEDRTVELTVPSDPNELREAYIEMAKLYLGERVDLEEALKVIDNQEAIIEDLTQTVSDLLEQIDSLHETIKVVRAAGTRDWLNTISLSPTVRLEPDGNGLYRQVFGASASYGVIWRERLYATIGLDFPLGLRAGIGVIF